MDYQTKIMNAKKIAEIFEIVKDMVKEHIGLDQAGLIVGVTDLGSNGQGFIGAFYSVEGNMIIINNRPLKRLLLANPSIYNYYLFHIMLHEYLHSVGAYDEAQARQLVLEISTHYFGNSHIITQLSTNMQKFMPDLSYPTSEFNLPEELSIDFALGIDRKNTNYIN